MRYLLILLTLSLISCGDIDGSVFGDETDSGMRNQNGKSLSRLYDNGEELKFALISDSHSNHTDLEDVIRDINRNGYDLAIHLGDITNTAYGLEFDLFAETIKELSVPYFITMGNHDALGSGEKIFQKLFGTDNFAFEFKGFKFIIINNVRETNGSPDYNWIVPEIESTSLPVLIFQHIPPLDEEVFTPNKLDINRSIMRMPNVKAVFYGHNHQFSSEYIEGKLSQMTNRTEGERYTSVSVSAGVMTIGECSAGGGCSEKTFYTIPSH
jgi:predicted phosphodiesterase